MGPKDKTGPMSWPNSVYAACFKVAYQPYDSSVSRVRSHLLSSRTHWPQCKVHRRDLKIIERKSGSVCLVCPIWERAHEIPV